MTTPAYPEVQLFIDGSWTRGTEGQSLKVLNPATGEAIGSFAKADKVDLDRALKAAQKGFDTWRKVSAFDRSKLLRRAADILRERADAIAPLLTLEQGKPLPEAKGELMSSADVIDWAAEEGRRTYGRIIPARAPGVQQLAIKEPIGPVAAFTPWNFPVSQVARKIAAGLAAGCSFIVKAPEDTPASPAELIRAFADAGLPAGVINLVYGDPAEISSYLIAHPTIRKVSFTGSVPVGKHLAALAGTHMKRATMELGGHAPVVVFDDANVAEAGKIMVGSKFRNAGQVCISPTRFYVQDGAYDEFLETFVAGAKAVKVGDGMDPSTTMGPLVSERRRLAVEELINDAVQNGATLVTGGKRVGNTGNFLEPTVLTDVTPSMRIMNEEPFGPVALFSRFAEFDALVPEVNRLPFGLAGYAFTRSSERMAAVSDVMETGMITINHLGLALPEVPFGGVKDSGYGSEGGIEAVEAYLNTKFVSQVGR
ncbi:MULTISPECIES: NAD-dependent succinate-semialdehyde dehydrogenase [unclassified Chelatococcus]|uniref:NAD-dependent succinate-semialdehyde dehydrogenase n=1 Tax=unclassified Chelatococcus TaxID=2638111 RepID=UPI001BCFB23F|nr:MULTISPECIES: NAD-dependent succinate-semialdehyde dehydrogenase [unclassified Chelatococcus]CAH1662442.1 Alpha-ketoglutaric semialdehyde dehydrogenase 1 [Hyphomicrobiales bacterium]MBS7741383.1 NAD-dependent succinate-semialdehyde dehydrogenase [Chelatococcus sp. HY11]MBX3546135.1 NAD-dependent succinate-semialdehyde dehydrogenase [Chelatococcus sp.]MCO5077216.1 NAD-dependent succinate-semialdehyde dehydrogenase [Chelatococcus sp.]CAH1682694.1 Alpha-ketoglutaric semialdehyde dehydrogenase 